jgi:hypothetical protein
MVEPDDRLRLRDALVHLSGCPEVYRRWVEMGLLRFSVDIVTKGPSAEQLHEADLLDAEQASSVEELAEYLVSLEQRRPGYLRDDDPAARAREFLFTHEFEDPDAEEMRRLARRSLTALDARAPVGGAASV